MKSISPNEYRVLITRCPENEVGSPPAMPGKFICAERHINYVNAQLCTKKLREEAKKDADKIK